MPIAPFIPLIAAGVSALGSWLSSRQQSKAVERSNKANLELSQYQYSKDLEMWNKQNEYNSPMSQMARYSEAGLNPNLIYGQGNSGNASSTPHYQAPTMRPVSNPIVDLPSMLSTYQDFQMKQAQIELTKQQVEKVATDTYSRNWDLSNIKPYQSQILQEKDRRSGIETDIATQKLQNLSQDERLKKLAELRSEKALQTMDIEQETKAAELLFKQYRNEWVRNGVTSSDNVLLRILVRMLAQSGVDPVSLLRGN